MVWLDASVVSLHANRVDYPAPVKGAYGASFAWEAWGTSGPAAFERKETLPFGPRRIRYLQTVKVVRFKTLRGKIFQVKSKATCVQTCFGVTSTAGALYFCRKRWSQNRRKCRVSLKSATA